MRDMSRLPKWAQDEMARLSEKVERLQSELDAARIGNDGKAECIWVQDSNDRWVPTKFHSGRIMLGDRWDQFIDFRLEDRDGEKVVYVHSGWTGVDIRPASSNAFHVKVRR